MCPPRTQNGPDVPSLGKASFCRLKYTGLKIESQRILNKHTMRTQALDAWQRARRAWQRRDSAALAVLLAYGLLAIATQLGWQIGGQGPDPVWAAARERGSLRVAVEFGYYPFSWFQNGEPNGYDIDLARAVAQKLGLRAEFVPSNLDSIYDDLATHKADIAASALPYAPEQGWRAGFSTFYFNAGLVLVVQQGASITGVEGLAGRRLGVALGTDADTYARQFAATHPSVDVHSAYDTPAEAFADMRRGQLDAVIADNAAALIDLGQTPGLQTVGPALTLEPYAIAMPGEAYQLRDAVNRALESLRQEGFFERNGTAWFVQAPARPAGREK